MNSKVNMPKVLMAKQLAFLLLITIVGAQDSPQNVLIGFNPQPIEYREPMLYDLDTYAGPPAALYRYMPTDMDQQEIEFMIPAEEHVSSALDYENNKNEVLMDIANPADYITKKRNKTFNKALLDLLDENEFDTPPEELKKRVLSPFRERMVIEKSKNHQPVDPFLKLDDEAEGRDVEINYDEDREYIDTLRDLLKKYKNSLGISNYGSKYNPQVVMSELKRKRQTEYPPLGWSGIGYKKQESPVNYAPANEALYQLRDHREDEMLRSRRFEWVKVNQPRNDALYEPEPRSFYNQGYMHAKPKRNVVSKRSSNYYLTLSPTHDKPFANKEQKYKTFFKNERAPGTDPDILKDLKNIFGNKEPSKIEFQKEKKLSDSKSKKAGMKKSLEASKKNTEITAVTTTKYDGKKMKRAQETELNNHKTSEHLNIKKKSLDWSKYFGYDRRKKSRQNDIDNEWLMERYHIAFASAKNKNTEYPLMFLRYHNEQNNQNEGKQEVQRNKKSDPQITNETKLSEMDSKLKNIEDLIIDEALKYTGAHEGTKDSKKIQEIKDKVISRLSAAYSLEKMRRALGEFKTSITSQRHALKYNEELDKDIHSEIDSSLDKRTADKFDENTTEIKKFEDTKKKDCRSGNALTFDEIQRPDLIKSITGINDYEILERRCRSVVRSVSAGEQSKFFYPLCKWHQICYLCSADDSQEFLTNCDFMFLSKAYVLCQGDLVCQWAARPTVQYLRDTYESTDSAQLLDKSICLVEMPKYADFMNQSGFKIRR